MPRRPITNNRRVGLLRAAALNGSAPHDPLYGSRSIIYRLCALLEILRRASGPVTAQQMADQWEVSTKTIYRDMDYLRAMGAVEVVTNRDLGHSNIAGYKIMAPPKCPWCGTEQFKIQKILRRGKRNDQAQRPAQKTEDSKHGKDQS